MSRICLYIDEDTIKSSLVKALRNSDLDIMTVIDTKMLGFSDEEQLAWATENSRVIYSFNIRDFCQLHQTYMAQNKIHAGIVLAPQRKYSIGQQITGLRKLSANYTAENMINNLLFLSAYIKI